MSGYEPDLTTAQIRASRFLHVSTFGRRRQTYFLSRISDQEAESLDADSWQELTAVSDRGAHHLLVRGASGVIPLGGATPDPGARSARNVDFPTLPPESLSPLSYDEELADLPEDLLQPLTAVRDALPLIQPISAEEQLAEGLNGSGARPRSFTLHASSPTREPPLAAVPPFPPEAPTTPLIRHLRRQLAAERMRTLTLATRVRELERRLNDLGMAVNPIPMDPDTTEL